MAAAHATDYIWHDKDSGFTSKYNNSRRLLLYSQYVHNW